MLHANEKEDDKEEKVAEVNKEEEEKKDKEENKKGIEKKETRGRKRKTTIDVDWKGFTGYKASFKDVETMTTEIRPKLEPKHFELLRTTPFFNFYNMFFENKIKRSMAQKCTESIHTIISKYVEDEKAFKLKENGKLITLRAEEVSLVFGIPLRGEEINLSDKIRQVNDFETKYFGDKSKKVNKQMIKALIKRNIAKIQKEEEDYVDLVKLLILHTCAAFFFARTGYTVPKSLIEKFTSLESISAVSWPKLIHKNLMTSVKKYCKKPTSVTGCVYLLLYFVAEHTGITTPIEGSQNWSPRALKWDLSKITKTNWVEKYQNLTEDQINQEISKPSEEEALLLQTTFNQDEQMENTEDAQDKAGKSNEEIHLDEGTKENERDNEREEERREKECRDEEMEEVHHKETISGMEQVSNLKSRPEEMEIKNAENINALNEVAKLNIDKVLLEQQIQKLKQEKAMLEEENQKLKKDTSKEDIEDENDKLRAQNEQLLTQLKGVTEMNEKMKREINIAVLPSDDDPIMAIPLTQLEVDKVEEKVVGVVSGE